MKLIKRERFARGRGYFTHLECEHCEAWAKNESTRNLTGAPVPVFFPDSARPSNLDFIENVLPTLKCEVCNKSASEEVSPGQSKVVVDDMHETLYATGNISRHDDIVDAMVGALNVYAKMSFKRKILNRIKSLTSRAHKRILAFLKSRR